MKPEENKTCIESSLVYDSPSVRKAPEYRLLKKKSGEYVLQRTDWVFNPYRQCIELTWIDLPTEIEE